MGTCLHAMASALLHAPILSLSVCVCVRARRLWGKAQELYMAAQTKARSGTLPFAEGEYLLWEEHWLK
jgi:phosphatidylinositol kinase/protein kinase (PI-3  family)